MIPIGTRVIVMKHRTYAGQPGTVRGFWSRSYLVEFDDGRTVWMGSSRVQELRAPDDAADPRIPRDGR